jgi:hypothetical protein
MKQKPFKFQYVASGFGGILIGSLATFFAMYAPPEEKPQSEPMRQESRSICKKYEYVAYDPNCWGSIYDGYRKRESKDSGGDSIWIHSGEEILVANSTSKTIVLVETQHVLSLEERIEKLEKEKTEKNFGENVIQDCAQFTDAPKA